MALAKPAFSLQTKEQNSGLLWLIGVRMLVVTSVVTPYLLYNPDQVSDPTLRFFIALTSSLSLIYIALLKALRRFPEIISPRSTKRNSWPCVLCAQLCTKS